MFPCRIYTLFELLYIENQDYILSLKKYDSIHNSRIVSHVIWKIHIKVLLKVN